MPTPRKGAIIGFGFIAKGGHLPAYQSCEALDIVAVADTCAARREAAHRALPSARIYENHEILLVSEASRASARICTCFARSPSRRMPRMLVP